MTDNKRFVNVGNEIYLGGEVWCIAGGGHCADVIATALNELKDENEQLRQTISKYADWIDSVKRADIDNIFKMSIFEIGEAFEYYEKRILELEKELIE